MPRGSNECWLAVHHSRGEGRALGVRGRVLHGLDEGNGGSCRAGKALVDCKEREQGGSYMHEGVFEVFEQLWTVKHDHKTIKHDHKRESVCSVKRL